ncbi:polyprenyl synthetase family protein [Streptomyces sp. NPDC052236]|uniref:polyprenyl synthetase family protein n=1 Tax=Streptomyces sp. NPDC052236 TaxID=3365686 RepID=UPI0037D12983
MSTTIPAHPLELDKLTAHVTTLLTTFLDTKREPKELRPLTDAITAFIGAGGKRIRPLMAIVGWHAAGAKGEEYQIMRVAAGLEMLHAAILIHDDVIDASATRRGAPTTHRRFAAQHHGPAADRFGAAAAITAGDVVFAWAEELLRTAGLTHAQLRQLNVPLAAMRQEVMIGQYLDVKHAGNTGATMEDALAICRYKTAHYTIHRPLQIGAALSYASPDVLDAMTAFGVPLGEAFQLRDDVLGVFGDPATTGKPNLDDLREGKHTALIAAARKASTPDQRPILARSWGNPCLTEDDAAQVRTIMHATAATATVGSLINTRHHQAVTALDKAPFPARATKTLHTLATHIVKRTS